MREWSAAFFARPTRHPARTTLALPSSLLHRVSAEQQAQRRIWSIGERCDYFRNVLRIGRLIAGSNTRQFGKGAHTLSISLPQRS